VTAVQSQAAARKWLAAVNPGAVRVHAGLTLTDLAAALQVTKMTVQRWETGARRPSGEHAVSYCRVIRGLLNHLQVPEGDP
jgi:DNA-binding transcriptional regulator YiaG